SLYKEFIPKNTCATSFNKENVLPLLVSNVLINIKGAYSSTSVKALNSFKSNGRCVLFNAIPFCITVMPFLLNLFLIKLNYVNLLFLSFYYSFFNENFAYIF